jgi:hypothetical protein
MARLQRDLNREHLWRQHIQRQRTSGMTAREYCRTYTLRETTFFYWRKEIAKRDRQAAAPLTTASPPAFVPVTLVNADARTASITPSRDDASIDIRLAAGHRLRIRAGCDRQLLADVLVMLRQPTPEGRPC